MKLKRTFSVVHGSVQGMLITIARDNVRMTVKLYTFANKRNWETRQIKQFYIFLCFIFEKDVNVFRRMN